jgi:Ser/Thr protein kinase RdoA (MazF antagonist)
MAVDGNIERILRLYPDDCRPQAVEPVDSALGFSGAKLWRITAPRGLLCLRRWPPEHPNQKRLEFIQAVLWHVDQEGFHLLPLPVETHHHHGYVWHAGHLWELVPWLPGRPDYRQSPSLEKLHNALTALARFHQAAATFPLPENGPAPSPGMQERRDRLTQLFDGGTATLAGAIAEGDWPELAARGRQLLALFADCAPKLRPLVVQAAELPVALQPCIRDIWHPHVLFAGDQVSGIVDFGSLRPENVACDIARLLGSLAGDNQGHWQRGLAAYQAVQRLTEDELALVAAFDHSTVLMGGLQWLQWIYVEGRDFSDRGAVQERLDEFLSRLGHLSQSLR